MVDSLGRSGSDTEWGYTTRHWRLVIRQTPSQRHANRATGDPDGFADASAIGHSPADGHVHTSDSITGSKTYFNPISLSLAVDTSANGYTCIAHSYTRAIHSYTTHSYASHHQHARTLTHAPGYPLGG